MRLRLILVGLFFALMFVYAGANAYLSFAPLSTSSDRGWYVSQRGDRVLISSVRDDGPALALQVGDEIVALNGQRVKTSYQVTEPFARVKPESHYTVVIQRDGQLQEFTLQTVPFPLSYGTSVFVQSVLVPASFLLIGFAVFLLKPQNKQALLFALAFGMFIPPNFFYSIEGLPWWLVGVIVAGTVVATFPLPVGFHFLLIFPEPSPLLRRFPRLRFYLYLPYLLIIFPVSVFFNVLRVIVPDRVFVFAFQLSPLVTIVATLGMMYVAGGLLSLLINYRQASSLSRRKMRVVLAGCLAGLLPWLVWYGALLLSARPRSGQLLWSWGWPSVAAHAALVLVPLAFAYAIVRHQVIPVSLIIRRGVQYLLAKNALRVILALPIIGLALTVLSNPNRTLAEILFRNSFYFYLLLIATVAISLVFRKRFGDWVDRKFFREHYNQEKILRELIEDVKKTDSVAEMSRLVSQKVDAALHPERLYLFYREEERRDLSLGYSSGGSEQELRIPEEFELLRFIEYQGSAQDFPFPQKTNLPQSEKDWLAHLGTKLIVPMTGTDNRLAGLFVLSGKKSEVPFTASDRQLLETLADQIAIVYENVRLKERVARDRRIKHEVLARVQERNINLLKECPRCGACFDGTVQLCASDGSELTLSLPVEQTIEGRYRLDRLIGKGGMGAVYEATDLRLNRKVAVKILGGQLFGNSEALRRFEREAQAAARLGHPHIITVYDYGVLNTEGAYLVMELVEGETLGSILKRQRHLAPAVAAEWLDQMLAAVGAAHGVGVIHRDLKPDNIFIASGEQGHTSVKVLDFGLAKIAHHTAESKNAAATMTTPGAVMGTFGYMSPEQLTGGVVDERSDLFSIGVIAVEALTGRRPFSERTPHELLTAILHKPFHLESNAPEAVALDKVLQKCLAKDPQDRFTSAAEMRGELIPAIRRCPVLARDASGLTDAETAILIK